MQGTLFQNKPLRQLLIITFAVNIVVTLGSGLLIYVFTYVYKYDDVKTSGIYFIQGILVIAAVVAAGFVSRKTEKKVVMAGGLILYMMAYLIVMIFSYERCDYVCQHHIVRSGKLFLLDHDIRHVL